METTFLFVHSLRLPPSIASLKAVSSDLIDANDLMNAKMVIAIS